jgi:competence ComEA-like helix-hairpin-helix protein
MARISLRTYIHEIEDLIDHGQIDQAVAHCRHILKYYPKHIDTYRMLGKAYLESRRYGDAADIFQRVISSVPEDFVAHLGMSIVREDEGNLDDAIWHMERAFEVQPANAAVQGELRRLYARRDGIEPPKVRLTRGALARMYVKGELYNQAIAELRAGLSEDPQRLDLQTLLARAYFLGGQRVEAAEMCTAIIKKLPYCLDANQILAEILSKTERGEEARAYAQRVHALNPYTAFISPTTPTLDKVPDNAVTLEKLDWKQAKSALEAGAQPEWAASLGVQVSELSPTNEPIPDWLAGIESSATSGSQPTMVFKGEEAELANDEEPPAGIAGQPAQPPPAVSPEEAIPEWMKEAGWRPSTGEAHEEPGSVFAFEEEETSPDISAAPAEIPAWLRSMAPEKGETGVPPAAVESPGPVPAWLEETPPGPTDSIVTWLEENPLVPAADAEIPHAADVEIPDWLQGLGDESKVEQAQIPEQKAFLPEQEAGLPEEAELPAFPESEFKPEEAPPVSQPMEEIPDWLKDLQPENLEAPEPAQPESAAQMPVLEEPAQTKDLKEELGGEFEAEAAVPEKEAFQEAAPATGITDWLKGLQAETAAPGEPAEEPSPSETPGETAMADGITDWLKGLPEESAEKALGEQVPVEGQPAEEVPNWLKALEAEPGAELEPAGEALHEETSIEAAQLKEVPDWMQTVEAGPETKLEVGEETQPEEVQVEAGTAEEVPEWLKGLEPEPAAELAPVDEIPIEVTPVEALPAEAVPGWLKSIETEPTLEAGPLEEAPVEETAVEAEAELPDWIKELQPDVSEIAAQVGEPPAEELPFEAVQGERLPDWLAELPAEPTEFVGQEAPVGEVPLEAAPAENMPEWLQELKAEQVESQESLEGVPTEAASAESISQWLEGLPQVPAGAEWTGEAVPGSIMHLEEPPLVEGDTKPSRITHPELFERPIEEAQPPAPDAGLPTEEVAEAPSLELPAEQPAEAPATGLPEWMAEYEEPAESAVPVEPAEMEAQVPPAEVKTPAVPTLSDEEAGFAWLESLAAKQGAEEALLLTPEERIETTPEWIKQELETAGQPEAAIPAPTEEVETVPIEVAPESELIAPEIPAESEVAETPPPKTVPEVVLEEISIVEETPPAVLEEAREAVMEGPPAEEEAPGELREAPPEIELMPEIEVGPEITELETKPVLEEAALQPGAAAEEPPEWLRETQAEETRPSETPALSDEDAAFAWLESLAVKQGASEALLMRPEDRPEETPTWVQEQVKKETGELKEPEVPFPGWLPEHAQQPEVAEIPHEEKLSELLHAESRAPTPDKAETVEMPPAEAITEAAQPVTEEAAPAYPVAQAAEPLSDAGVVPPQEPPVEAAVKPPTAEAVPELPSWLAEMEAAPTEEEEPVWQPPEAAAPAPVAAETAPLKSGEAPQEKINLNTAGLAELERLPGVGFIRAQSAINYRDLNGAFNSVEELAQVSGFDAALASELSQWLYVETARPAIEAALKDYPATLIQARNELLQGNQTEALVHYNNLIKTRQALPEVIQDLQEALYRYPIDINIWQALGDAYARNGQIQDALNAYTKAEELLR